MVEFDNILQLAIQAIANRAFGRFVQSQDAAAGSRFAAAAFADKTQRLTL